MPDRAEKKFLIFQLMFRYIRCHEVIWAERSVAVYTVLNDVQ